MKKKFFNKSLIALSCLAFIGCNLDTPPESQSFPSNSDKIIAYDKFATTPLNTPLSIDLSSLIKGENVTINGIISDTPNRCYSYVEDTKKVNVEMAKLGRCEYIYTAENALGSEAKGKITLISSLEDDYLLDTISETYTVDKLNSANPIEINILLSAEQMSEEYEIKTEPSAGEDENSYPFVVESKAGANSIKVEKKDRLTLSIDKEESYWQAGWHQISYKLVNAKQTSLLEGEVFISIASETNHPPIISPTTFSYENLPVEQQKILMAEIKKPITVNLGDFLCKEADNPPQNCLSITDPNNHAWSLFDVNTMPGADVWFTEHNLVNKSFNFEAYTSGVHQVVYVIKDNEGAQSIGVIKLLVDEKDFGYWRDWGALASALLFAGQNSVSHFHNDLWQNSCKEAVFSLTTDIKCFTPPFTHKEAFTQYGVDTFNKQTKVIKETIQVGVDQNNNPIWGEVDKEIALHVTLWTKEQAENHCYSHNANPLLAFSLPSIAQLQNLKTISEINAWDHSKFNAAFAKWPKERCYFTREGALYNFKQSAENYHLGCTEPDNLAYATCFAEGFKIGTAVVSSSQEVQ